MNNKFLQAICFFIAFLLLSTSAEAQKKYKPGKYPSLLWEISGNGMKKPSYLFGTMHVSSKLAFHLGDSFYVALNNVDVVAIETKPDIWQQKLFENDDADLLKGIYGMRNIFSGFSGTYLKKGSLAFGKYEKGIEVALAMEPAMVNNLLYRSYDYNNDFEEDTYLDMYIYQIGCKLKKQTTGVEDYEETERLVDEAYEDMYKEKNKKRKSYDYADFKNGGMNLNDAYRNGDLDLLDSINRMSSISEAFDEKFLYKRNEIQANSIDSIIKIHPLFVGVGAAHLPGERGVIELLRKKGYKLRAIKMGERDGRQKDMIENIRVPVTFNQQVATDSFYKVSTPDKLYKADNSMISRSQYADMSNGSYYVVTRLKTNGLMWGQSTDKALKKVDSLLYENVPGKIIKKETITKSGYKGYNIINRTRKGDMQRYNIFVTPFEIIFFKISGTGDYISKGDEATKFFNSIELQPFKSSNWKKYVGPKGGFAVELPQSPIISREENATPSRWQFDSYDNIDGSNYLVMKTDVHNISFAGEDTFDLNLMAESFGSSDFIDRQLSSRHLVYKGYPAMECSYKHKDSSVSKVRFLIQGPHYYSLVAHGKKEQEQFNKFLNSFTILPYHYGPSLERKDTLMGLTVKSPVFPEKKTDLKTMLKKMIRTIGGGYRGNDEMEEGLEELKNFSTLTLGDDSTGEKVQLFFVKSPKYNFEKDSSFFKSKTFKFGDLDSSVIYRLNKDYTLQDGTRVLEVSVTDSGSSRLIRGKFFSRDGVLLGATALTDTISPVSTLLNDVFATMSMSDTIKGTSPYTKKTSVFFADYFSGDSVLRKRTLKIMNELYVDSSDVPMIKKAIADLKWGDKDYLDTKSAWINKLSDINSAAVTDYLKNLYREAGDTSDLQNTVLSVLLEQRTQYSFNAFKDIFLNDPPAPSSSDDDSYDYSSRRRYSTTTESSSYNSYFGNLYDSLPLTKTIFTEMLPLINVDDYKTQMLNLLAKMVDSGYVSAKEYEPYSTKIYLEAKNELKKQQAAEKKNSLQKAIRQVEEKDNPNTYNDYSNEKDYGNDELVLYARLLIPYWDKNPGVPTYFEQMLKSGDKRLKYDAAMLLLKNKKQVPDSIFDHYAAMDEYRYELYNDLYQMDKLEKFPGKNRDLLQFAKGMLANSASYGHEEDTIIYLDKFKIDYRDNKGWVYFFKYKEKKDDPKWKIATSGLLPDVIDSFFVRKKYEQVDYRYDYEELNGVNFNSLLSNRQTNYVNFTKFSDTSIDEEEPLDDQLKKYFKELVYSLHKSAAEFYDNDTDWFRSSMYQLGGKYKYGE